MRKPLKIGDVVEITTPKGLAYAQFTHKHPQYGALIRVKKGLYQHRPAEFESVVSSENQFITFFPLAAACKQGVALVVSNEPVPVQELEFPTFRSGVPNKSGVVECWWLWDGNREWRVERLQPGMESLPVRGVWNDTLLIERIVSGWSSAEAI